MKAGRPAGGLPVRFCRCCFPSRCSFLLCRELKNCLQVLQYRSLPPSPCGQKRFGGGRKRRVPAVSERKLGSDGLPDDPRAGLRPARPVRPFPSGKPLADLRPLQAQLRISSHRKTSVTEWGARGIHLFLSNPTTTYFLISSPPCLCHGFAKAFCQIALYFISHL